LSSRPREMPNAVSLPFGLINCHVTGLEREAVGALFGISPEV
jgi:hypothetical protein